MNDLTSAIAQNGNILLEFTYVTHTQNTCILVDAITHQPLIEYHGVGKSQHLTFITNSEHPYTQFYIWMEHTHGKIMAQIWTKNFIMVKERYPFSKKQLIAYLDSAFVANSILEKGLQMECVTQYHTQWRIPLAMKIFAMQHRIGHTPDTHTSPLPRTSQPSSSIEQFPKTSIHNVVVKNLEQEFSKKKKVNT